MAAAITYPRLNSRRITRQLALALIAAALGARPAVAQTIVYPGKTWTRRSPEELGLDATALGQFVERVGGVGCVIKDGYLVREWGDQRAKADWASAMKPVMSTLLLFAIAERKIASADTPIRPYVRQLFPNRDLAPKDRAMTFRHLANMVSGYGLPERPGAAWGYNDYAINLYSKVLFDGVFKDEPNRVAIARLGALQFEDGSLFASRQGYGVRTTPRDFARIGWLWLNRGRWRDRQLLPRELFDRYLKPGVPADLPRTSGGKNDYLDVYFTGGGTDQTPHGPGIYGFNWWFNAEVAGSGQRAWPAAPPDTFQANGHWRKEVMTVIPSLGIVAAARGDWGDFSPGNANSGANQVLKLLVSAHRAAESAQR